MPGNNTIILKLRYLFEWKILSSYLPLISLQNKHLEIFKIFEYYEKEFKFCGNNRNLIVINYIVWIIV